MNILKFYNQLEVVPPNLVRHHLEVGAVTQHCLNYWRGPKLDRDLALRTALLHDVGNLVKYTFPLESRMYHEVIKNEDFWYQKHRQLVKKYGRDADLATEAILKEHGFVKEAELLQEIRVGKYLDDIVKISHEAKLVFLADGVVSPAGVVGVATRIADVMGRYAGSEKMLLWVEALRQNQKFLQNYIDLKLDELTNITWEDKLKKIKNYELEMRVLG